MVIVINIPFPPGYGSVDASQPIDKKLVTTIGVGDNQWIQSSSGVYYFDIFHEFGTQEIIHEAYKETIVDGGKDTIYPEMKRLSDNTMRVFWNSAEQITVILLRIAEAYI